LADRAFPDAHALFSYEMLQVGIFALILLLSGIVLVVWRSGRTFEVRGNLIPLGAIFGVLLVAADLMVAWWGFHSAADPALLDFTPPVVEFLAQDEGLWRFTTYDEPGANTFNANSGWYYEFSDARGYDSLIPKQYADYAALIAPQTQLPFNRVAPIFTDTPGALESPLLDLLGVKYVLTETTIETPGFEQVYSDESGITVYENTRAAPRAFTLPMSSTIVAEDFGEAAQDYDVRQYVVVDDPDLALWEGEPLPGELQPATVTVYTPNEVWIDVQVDAASWLVVSDSYFPGWRAYRRPIGGSDAEETELDVYLVDGNFRGVILMPGVHTIRMKYSPDSVKFGAFTSFMSLALVVFALGVWLWRYAYHESDDASAVRRVAKNSLAPIALNLFNRGIDFAFAFLMLRILRPEGAGNYYYAIVIWGWFEILTNFGLNTFLTREVARAPDDARRYLFNTSLLRMLLAVLGIPLLIGFVGLRQAAFEPSLTPDTVWAIGLLYAGLFASSLSTGLTALFYAFEKAEFPAAITTITTFLKATVGIVALLAGAGIVGLAGVSIFTNMVTLGILWTMARRSLEPLRSGTPLQIDRALQRHMIGESFPLMINHLLATLFFKIDVVLLEVIRGPATVGRYSTAYKWLDALNIIPSFFTLAMFPVMSRQAAEDRPALLRAYVLAIKLMVVIALPVAVATTLIARALIGVLGGAEYLPDGAIALQLIIWSIPIGWINSVTQYVLIALDRQRILTRAFVVGVVFNVGANLIFMPTYGFRAAAIITIFSELTLLVAFYLTLRNALADATPEGQREPVSWAGILWRPLLAAGLMAGCVLILLPFGQLPALAVGGLVYLGATLVLPPLTRDEFAQITPLLPARLRAGVSRAFRLERDAV
jgi:O-antigen/teichoic acid export membrane protein